MVFIKTLGSWFCLFPIPKKRFLIVWLESLPCPSKVVKRFYLQIAKWKWVFYQKGLLDRPHRSEQVPLTLRRRMLLLYITDRLDNRENLMCTALRGNMNFISVRTCMVFLDLRWKTFRLALDLNFVDVAWTKPEFLFKEHWVVIRAGLCPSLALTLTYAKLKWAKRHRHFFAPPLPVASNFATTVHRRNQFSRTLVRFGNQLWQCGMHISLSSDFVVSLSDLSGQCL